MIHKLTRTIVRTFAFALALCATTSAWAVAPTATVVWESDFGTTKTVDGSTFEIVPNSASIDANGNLAIGSTTGSSYTSPTLAIPAAFQSDKITVLIKYSGLAAYSAANAALSSVKAEYDGGSIVYGLRSNGTGSLNLIGYNEAGSGVSSLGSTVSLGTGAGYYLVSTDTGVGVYGYTGTHVKGLSGSSTALKKTSNWKVTSVSLGGSHGVNRAYAWAGVTIEKVAIFIGNAYSNTDLADYVWPSAEKYRKWTYANNTYTWVPSKDESDIGSSSNGTLYLFDVASGENTSIYYSSGGDNWKQFCIGQSQYSAPGCALRFTSSSANKTFTGGFNPFTFGGIIVESDAGGLSIGKASDGRTTVFGAASGVTETWFSFDADASVIRSGAFRFSGNVNLDIANGKRLSLAAAGSPAIVASVDNNQMATTAGGTLRVHGGGKLAATLNASGAALDFSDQPTASASAASAYIQGALTVDSSTTFTFPEGATFPYFVATSISGDIDHNTGYKANADGSISVVVPTVLNITSAETVELPTTWTSSDDAVVNVSAGIDATLNVTAAATLSTITFYVPATSTLTISGSAITASTISFPQPGVVKVTSSGALVGTAKGSGVVQYSGVLPTISNGISFSNAAWTGTMWLKDFGELSGGKVNSNLTADMASWGNTGSKVKFTNVKAYAPSSNVTCNYTLVLEDGTGSEEYAWRCDNGYSSNSVTFNALSGTGTFYDGGTVTAPFKFNALSDFTGVFNITGAGHKIGIGANCSSNGGTIALGSGIAVTFTDGHPWTTGNGFVVNSGATLNVNTDATVKFTDQGMLGTLNIAKGKTLTAASSDAVSYGSAAGTVKVYGTLNFGTSRWTLGPNVVINLYDGATISGTGDSYAAMDFNVAGGSTIHAIGNATVSCRIRNDAANGTAKIDVEEGKTLTFSGNLAGNYGFKKQGAGVLKLTGTVAKFPAIDAGTVLLGGNKTWNLGTLRDFTGYTLEEGSSIAITQTNAEYGSGVTTVTGVDSSIASITVNKADGTTATLTRTDSTSTLVESVVVSGAACWYDFTFNNTITSSSASSAGAVTLGKDAGPAYGTLTDAANNTYPGLYAYCRPYKDINLGSTTQFTVALYGTMPTADNTILLDCGGCGSAGALLLASGSSANEAKLYYYNSSGLTPLATMAATGCRTTPHLYVFEKISDHQVNIYLDGKLALAYVNNDITFTLTAGFQVASGYAGVPSGLNAIAKTATTDTTIIAMTRIYDRIISDAEMAVLKTEWPYFSPNGDSARTLASGETAADWTETGKWTVNNASADKPLANSVVTLTNSSEADAAVAVNLDADTEYESVKFAGDAAISVALKSGYTGKIVPASTSFETDTTVAYNAMNLTEGAVEVAAGKTLTFDVSSLVDANWANVASIASIQLTGAATLGTESSIAVTPTTSGYWNLAAEADAGGNYYLTFTPNRETGSIYWQSGTYWNSTYQSGDSPAVFTTDAEGQNATKYFAGDTVIIPTTTKRYFGPISDGAAIQFDCNGAIEVTKTDSLGYVFKNATVTVASGTTLNFVNSWNGSSPEVYGGTISGAGKVQVASGITLTLSNGATINSATALAGAGTVNLASVPAAQMTFDNWTGTVKLPQFAAAATKLNFAGNASSTVALAGITSGWLGETTAQRSDVAPTLRLDGDVTITGMSTSWQYSFEKITGTGNLSFTSADAPSSLAITEIADYTGTLNNSTTTALTVRRISLASAPAADTLLLATNGTGTVTVNAVYVNGADSGMQVVYKEGGVYSPAATYVAQYGETKYETIQEAIDAAEQAGGTYTDVTILDPNATCPDGYYVDTEDNDTLKMYQAALVDTDGEKHYFYTPQAAVDAIAQYLGVADAKIYAYYEVYYGENVAIAIDTSIAAHAAWVGVSLKIKCAVGASVAVTLASTEYELTAGTADDNGIVTYTKTDKATTYVWAGATSDSASTSKKNYARADNWKVGTSSGATATRAPGSLDTVVFGNGAYASTTASQSVAALQVSGAVTFIGGGSLTSASAITLGASDSITITGALSPEPTAKDTTNYRVRKTTVTVDGTTTYTVVDKVGTIFSVY